MFMSCPWVYRSVVIIDKCVGGKTFLLLKIIFWVSLVGPGLNYGGMKEKETQLSFLRFLFFLD